MSSGWDDADRDAFVAMLRRDDVNEPAIARTLSAAEKVIAVSGPLRDLAPRHVDVAIERASWAGDDGAEQAWIREAGDALLRFVREDPPRRRRSEIAGEGAPPLSLMPESRAARRTPPSLRPSGDRPLLMPTRGGPPPGKCPSCAGTLRSTAAGAMRSWLLGGAVVSIALVARLDARVGPAGDAALIGGTGSLAVLLGALGAAHVCERCERRVGAAHLDPERLRALSALRTRAAVIALVGTIATIMAALLALAR